VGGRLKVALVALVKAPTNKNMSSKEPRYDQRVSAQIAQYANVENMNVMSDAWHYWQTEYFLPRYRQVMGVPTPFHLYLETFAQAIERTGVSQLLSVGFGDGVIEARLVKELRERGFADCRIDAVEISAAQIERGRNNAEKQGVLDAFQFIECDTNSWKPEKQYAGVMVHQALHHIQELESFFASVKQALLPEGRFVTFDVVGRNGHMRWPEALEIVHSLWKILPSEKRRHHILNSLDYDFVNRDCSSQGFEGIRAQDILPLLVQEFAFEKFLAWGGLTDVFVSRGFGPNFDMKEGNDKAFIDHVAKLNDILIDAGHIKPTVIAAVMHKGTQGEIRCFRNWTPSFAVRPVDIPTAVATIDTTSHAVTPLPNSAAPQPSTDHSARTGAERPLLALAKSKLADPAQVIRSLQSAGRALREKGWTGLRHRIRAAKAKYAGGANIGGRSGLTPSNRKTRPESAESGVTDIHRSESNLETAQRKYLAHIGEILHHETSVDQKLLETTDWYYKLLKGVINRNSSVLRNGQARYLELASYRHILGYKLSDEFDFESTQFDICKRDLLEARSLALTNGFQDNVNLVVGDYHSLPFADGSFDVVFVSAAIHHSKVPKHIIGEAMRVLRNGGIFYCQREPARRSFCFYQFVANRPHSHTEFERHLSDSGLMRIVSSPFPGARNSLLFGRIENDQIELDEYYEAFADWGVVREEVVYHEGLLTNLDKEILAEAGKKRPNLSEFIRQRLEEEIDEAAKYLSPRDKLLGHAVPSREQIRAMAERTAANLNALPKDTASPDWQRAMGRIFGASLRFVVERTGGNRKKPEQIYARDMVCDESPVLSDPTLKLRSGLDFGRRVLPSLQEEADFDWQGIFPADDWQECRLPPVAGNDSQHRKKFIAKSATAHLLVGATVKSLFVLRVWCKVPLPGAAAHVELATEQGDLLCRNFYPQSEDQAIVAMLSAGEHKLLLKVSSSNGSSECGPMEVSVCQLLPIV
jgi:ubiquinone/menaquinone biosynthesis C-methylase UbiE